MSALLCAAVQTSAQVSPVPHGQVVLTKLSPPIYPPLARAARVSGDVEISLRIRQDSSVESAEVVKGHPLLREAALDSARQSKFECRECGEAPVPYSVLYTFGYTTNHQCSKTKKTPLHSRKRRKLRRESLNGKTTSRFSLNHFALSIRAQMWSRFVPRNAGFCGTAAGGRLWLSKTGVCAQVPPSLTTRTSSAGCLILLFA
jgi:TonB family protein